MPSYNANPGVNTPVKTLLLGTTGFAFGSFDATVPTTLLQVSQVASSGGTATVTVLVREGKIPTINGLITIRGTSTAAGVFNVVNAPITGVSIDPALGTGTITFALAGTVAPTADNGMAYVPVPTIGEALAPGASQQFSMQGFAAQPNGITITWGLKYPSPPAAVNVALQVAMFDNDADYQTVDTSTNAAGDLRYATLTDFNFIRMKVVSASGGSSPTIVGTISI